MNRIQDIRTRLSKITPGCWKLQEGFNTVFTTSNGDGTGLTIALAKISDRQLVEDGHSEQVVPNGEFIANAPEDTAYLLVEINRLAEDLEEARRQYTTLEEILMEADIPGEDN